MLQIISGKFFKGKDLYIHQGKGITFSNFNWVSSIETCVATLEPVDYGSSITPYVISYINKIEKDDTEGFGLVRTGDSTIVEQFQLLCTFGFNAFFDVDRERVELNCRPTPRSSADSHIPAKFVRRFFDEKVNGNQLNIDSFIEFVSKVIGLPRHIYKSIINCLNNYSDALQVLNYNLDLAYSMLVYCLESLCQQFDSFETTWADYSNETKDKLEIEFLKIEPSLAEQIKSILLDASFLKLQQRFIGFIEDNVEDSFFIEQAIGIKAPLRKSLLKQALLNSYKMRSGYVHSLKPIRDHLKMSQIAEGDVFYWGNQPYLTFAGLTRLTHHVIYNFISKQAVLETEDFNWRNDLPGLITLELAPQYWIWKHEEFSQEQATSKLSGFLNHLIDAISSGEMTDLRKLLEKYESIIPSAKKKYKIQMITIYWLYNIFRMEEDRVPDWRTFLGKYNEILNECSIEMMLAYVLIGIEWEWPVNECAAAYENYCKQKFKKNALKIPGIIQVALIIQIANYFLSTENFGEYDKWLDLAILELPGQQDLQENIKDSKQKRVLMEISPLQKSFLVRNIHSG